jgi:hypothetical protein
MFILENVFDKERNFLMPNEFILNLCQSLLITFIVNDSSCFKGTKCLKTISQRMISDWDCYIIHYSSLPIYRSVKRVPKYCCTGLAHILISTVPHILIEKTVIVTLKLKYSDLIEYFNFLIFDRYGLSK